jgi:hypothetical protein
MHTFEVFRILKKRTVLFSDINKKRKLDELYPNKKIYRLFEWNTISKTVYRLFAKAGFSP